MVFGIARPFFPLRHCALLLRYYTLLYIPQSARHGHPPSSSSLRQQEAPHVRFSPRERPPSPGLSARRPLQPSPPRLPCATGACARPMTAFHSPARRTPLLAHRPPLPSEPSRRPVTPGPVRSQPRPRPAAPPHYPPSSSTRSQSDYSSPIPGKCSSSCSFSFAASRRRSTSEKISNPSSDSIARARFSSSQPAS